MMHRLKIIPLLESVSDMEDEGDDRVTSSEVIEEFTKTPSYKVFSKKLNDAAASLDSLLTSFCTEKYGEKVSDDELQDAKTRMMNKIIKQYV